MSDTTQKVAGYDDLGAPDWEDGDGDTGFKTDAVKANLAAEHGLGLGAAELAAQRDPAGAVRDAMAGADSEDDDSDADSDDSEEDA